MKSNSPKKFRNKKVGLRCRDRNSHARLTYPRDDRIFYSYSFPAMINLNVASVVRVPEYWAK